MSQKEKVFWSIRVRLFRSLWGFIVNGWVNIEKIEKVKHQTWENIKGERKDETNIRKARYDRPFKEKKGKGSKTTGTSLV